ncbi:MAG: MFS transporter [Nocardioidaceae bacterium]
MKPGRMRPDKQFDLRPSTAESASGKLGGLGLLLAQPRFRQLFAVRIAGQTSDGIFQVALASYLLFSPERQPDAASIAAVLAAVLLPFSVLGPFAGVFLDRWSRRQVLVLANLARTVPVLLTGALIAAEVGDLALFSTALAAFSINRFLLAGLSAGLPHVVEPRQLVLANSIVPTTGTLGFLIGLGGASALRAAPSSWLPTDLPADVGLALLAAGGFGMAAALASRIPRDLLGPDVKPDQPRLTDALGHVGRGLAAGLRHLRERPAAAWALMAIGAQRFFYGLSTVATILLYRNYFHDPADTDAGLAGLSVAVLVSGVGFVAAAVITPAATRRWSPRSWIVGLLVMAAVVEAFPGAFYTVPTLLVAAFWLGISAQGVKICVDTLVQAHVDDVFRGRAFALYDVVFNVVFVAAAAVGAVVIPVDGKSYALVAAISLGYAATAVTYLLATRPGSTVS